MPEPNRRLSARVFCTYFDVSYEARGRLMVESLRGAGEDALVVVVCFDESSLRRVQSWIVPGAVPVSLAELEQRVPALLALKGERSRAEYFFTCTPWVTALALDWCAPGGWVTYLDADLAFYSPPEPIFAELADASVGLIDHFHRRDHSHLERFGRFNVGWVSFRADENGRKALQWWGEQCLEWCGDHPVDGRFADQGYLDAFPERFAGVHEIQHPGANLGPFNVDSRRVTAAGTDEVSVDGQPLLFFHFHGVRPMAGRYVSMHIPFGTRPNEVVRERIYRPYVDRLAAAESAAPAPRPARRGTGWKGMASRSRRRWYYLRSIMRGESWRPSSPTPLEGRATSATGS